MQRIDNARSIRAPRGSSLTAKSWLTEAPLRMLMNNLDAEVAEKPGELVVYGSSPQITVSVAPQRLFGLPIYGSLTNEVGRLPFRQVTGNLVTNDRGLTRVDTLPTLRAALSRLSFLSFNTSAAYRTTFYSRSADLQGRPIDEPLLRKYLSLRSDVVGPVLAKIWDTPGSGYSERMKHLVEPTFALEYLSAIPNAGNVLTLSDSRDHIPGGSTRITYGVNNRLLARARTSVVCFVTAETQRGRIRNTRVSAPGGSGGRTGR